MSRLIFLLSLLVASSASAVTFEWVEIDHPGNAPKQQTPGAYFGDVAYVYQMAKYEVTNAQYAQFLNWKAASDPLGLYDTNMGTSSYGGIARSGSPGAYSYTAIEGREDMPVTFVSFIDAARFVNWLHNGQGGADTETGAYTLEGGTADPSNWQTVTRDPEATVFIPSENEWYKAAYHNAVGLSSTSYFDYPCGSNTVPVCSAPTATPNRANCNTGSSTSSPLRMVGSYPGSPSAYGTFDQGGNVAEWTEALSTDGFVARRVRGGSWDQYAADTRASYWFTASPLYGSSIKGLRVATLPEPGAISALASGAFVLFGLAGLGRRRA